MMRIVLLGAPGSGKGTQAQRLQAKFGVPQVSSGDLLRDAVARKTELGLQAKAAMEAGQLVSDEIVLGLIRERLAQPDAQNGFILDGFPRNSDQAATLSQLLIDIGQPLEAVLLMDVRTKTLIERLAGRRVCRACGAVHSLASLPAPDAPCTKCGGELYQRPDDKEEVITKRLDVYQSQTKPLIEHYQKLGLLKVIKGEGTLEQITARMEAALAKPEAKSESKPAAKPKKKAVVKEAVAEVAAKPVAAPAAKAAVKKPAKKSAKKTVKKAAKKVAKKKAAAKAKAAPVKKATKKTQKKAVKKASKKIAKKSAKKSPKKPVKKVTRKVVKQAKKKVSKKAARKK
jgi:adenylate kinase